MLPVTVLENAFVGLEPFEDTNMDAVRTALDHDPAAWDGMVSAAYGPHFDAWWDAAILAMQSQTRIAYAVRRKSDNVIVGTTSLYEIRPEHSRCELGSTFYRPDVRGGLVNSAAKLLLLDHAFDHGMARVEIITDALNMASQAAIRKLGAVYEGRLRKHKRTWTGRMRDTQQFSITEDDWPLVRAGLEERLQSGLKS